MITWLLLAAGVIVSPGRPGTRISQTDTGGGTATRARPTMMLFVFTLGLGTLLFLLVGQLSVAVAGGIAVTTAVGTIRDMRAAARRQRRSGATAIFLGHLLGELRAGAGMPQAMTAAAVANDQAPEEFQEVIKITAARAQAGGSGAAVLFDAQEEVPELRETAQLWRTAEQHGIPMAPLIEQAQARIDARDRHRAATSASLQGPQATAIVLTVLPAAGVLMGMAMGANPLGMLLSGGLGGILLVVGVSLSCGGFYWSRRIIEGAQR